MKKPPSTSLWCPVASSWARRTLFGGHQKTNAKAEPRRSDDSMNPMNREEMPEPARVDGLQAQLDLQAVVQAHRQNLCGTGQLRNGNRSGDPSTAPRCGAKTRAGHACLCPA